MGFNFTKISAEKFPEKVEKVNLKSNLNVSSINPVNSEVLNINDTLLGVDFNYNIDYKPNFAKIEFKGDLLVAVSKEQADSVIKEWENKKMPDDFKVKLFNLILRKISIKSLELEDEMGLPLHMSMPRVQSETTNPEK